MGLRAAAGAINWARLTTSLAARDYEGQIRSKLGILIVG